MFYKTCFGLLLGFAIGFGCALLNVPVPAPPILIGALLVVAMTLGYLLMDRHLCSRCSTRDLTSAIDKHQSTGDKPL
ncbi:MAG: XapX domain-containing protein [Cellvibrionaceae bacterium]|jgi:XapX domain-containing protein